MMDSERDRAQRYRDLDRETDYYVRKATTTKKRETTK
jgi:hypothetical protein